MISAIEAHVISKHHENLTFAINDEIKEQAEEISNIISKVAEKGYFTYFYDCSMYSEVYKMLEKNGFNLEMIFECNENNIKVFKGVNISW